MPPNHFESEVESFLEGSHGDRTHIKRADHHTVTPLCGTLLRKNRVRFYFCHVSARILAQLYAFSPGTSSTQNDPPSHVARRPGWLVFRAFSGGSQAFTTARPALSQQKKNRLDSSRAFRTSRAFRIRQIEPFTSYGSLVPPPPNTHRSD